MQSNDPDVQQVIATTDRLWIELREYNKDIVNYLSGDSSVSLEIINKILHISLKLIISELLVNKEEYEKYTVRDYNTDDFIQIAIIDSGKKKIDYSNREQCEEFMEGIREVMWGYIKQYYNELSNIILLMSEDKRREITEKEYARLMECVCVAYIEANFRERELYFLEREFK